LHFNNQKNHKNKNMACDDREKQMPALLYNGKYEKHLTKRPAKAMLFSQHSTAQHSTAQHSTAQHSTDWIKKQS